VWIDPAVEPLWRYQAQERDGVMASLAGEPQRIGSYVLVPEASGVFTWLNADTGSVLHHYQPPSLVIPATGVAALGADRALAPLTDGTFMQLAVPPGMTGSIRGTK
jgi:hypothetical protein